MFTFVRRHKVITGLLVVSAFLATYLITAQINRDPLEGLVTTTVERGTVETLVSVSGITKARNAANLAFPAPGIVSKVYVSEGDVVEAGTVLATLGAEELVATRASAISDLAVAEADLAELLNGDTASQRDITDTKVAIAQAELKRIEDTQAILVNNARRALLSGTLIARSEDVDESAPAPIISGTYNCDTEGVYTLDVYRSSTDSGYSMRISGLETGSAGVSTDQPAPIGKCGLFALFNPNASYGDSLWNIAIPNTTGDSYTVNKNALTAAENTARTSIDAAKQALTLAQQEQVAANAYPRSEAVTKARARIDKATATINQIDAQIGDRTIVAPFRGTITKVDIVTGETAGTAPVFTLLAENDIELRARIPEIDITTIAIGQSARVVFDADTNTQLLGTVTYISPLPIQIDGVGYFEITITLDSTPAWLRGGLNADVDVVIESTQDIIRIPKRYLIETQEGSFIRTLQNNSIATTSVVKIVSGNDGWVGIDGVSLGTTIVTP